MENNTNKTYEINLRLFIAFLKLNNAYERYFINLQKSKRKHRFIDAIILNPYYTIDKTLIWDGTNEGWFFWNKINQECCKFFRKCYQEI